MKIKSEFCQIITERGLGHQFTNLEALDNLLAREKNIPCYIGFDATASSLHVGSLLPIMILRHFQKSGHKPIVLMGGGTTMVGDPSGKDEARKIITPEIIHENIQGIQKIFAKFLTFGDSGNDAMMANNAEWLLPLNYIEFLRDIGQFVSVNRMLQMDSVKSRLERESHLSFLEFNYMVLQAYDFMELHRRYKCRLQMGGSDQWGNIVSGIELAHKIDGAELFGLTTPLLTTSSGAKMGKSAKGAVWLNEDLLSSYDYWQFWRNTEDADVVRFLKIFTEIPLPEIEKLSKLQGQEINEAKIILANHATTMVHGAEKSKSAFETAQNLYSAGVMGGDIAQYKLSNYPINIVNLLVDCGFCSSNSDARRNIQGGAIRLNDRVISDANFQITNNEMINNTAKLSFGKKKHLQIIL